MCLFSSLFCFACVAFCLGTESEISFSGSGLNKSRRHGRESMSITSASTKLLPPNSKPVRIAAINGKPRVQRYLSRECKF